MDTAANKRCGHHVELVHAVECELRSRRDPPGTEAAA
jgi:hypothetical protein